MSAWTSGESCVFYADPADRTWRGLAEEAPTAYKDVTEVVETSERAGLARKLA